MMPDIQWDRIAHSAYREKAGGPAFDDLSPEQQAAWKASALAVANRTLVECYERLQWAADMADYVKELKKGETTCLQA